jgi:plasmid stabilization system protein ParE
VATPRIRWTRLALQDLIAARAYVEKESPASWKKIAMRVRAALAQLRRHPRSGRFVPERRAQGYREVNVPPYRLVYAIKDGREVHVLRSWHARRDPKGL